MTILISSYALYRLHYRKHILCVSITLDGDKRCLDRGLCVYMSFYITGLSIYVNEDPTTGFP